MAAAAVLSRDRPAVAAAAVAALVVEALRSGYGTGWVAWIAGTVFTAVVCLLGHRRRELIEALREAQSGLADRVRDEERTRVARELHDVIGHSLTVSLLHLSSARLAIEEDPAAAAQALTDAEDLARSSLTATSTSMPVLPSCIAFGLSMDHEVFLVSRITELHDGGDTTADAVAHGLARTGRIVTTAAALLAVSFFALGTGKVSFIQFFGLGTGLAILLDATLVRGLLVPAAFGALGERSWYAPRILRRLHARIGLSEAGRPR